MNCFLFTGFASYFGLHLVYIGFYRVFLGYLESHGNKFYLDLYDFMRSDHVLPGFCQSFSMICHVKYWLHLVCKKYYRIFSGFPAIVLKSTSQSCPWFSTGLTTRLVGLTLGFTGFYRVFGHALVGGGGGDGGCCVRFHPPAERKKTVPLAIRLGPPRPAELIPTR